MLIVNETLFNQLQCAGLIDSNGCIIYKQKQRNIIGWYNGKPVYSNRCKHKQKSNE